MYVSKNTRKVYVTSIIYDDKGYVFICQSTNCIIQGKMLLIIKGHQNNCHRLSDDSRARCEKALKIMNNNPISEVIISGGIFNSKQKIPVSEAMKKYIIENFNNPIKIKTEIKSRTTIENIENTIYKFSLNPNQNIIIVTSWYHTFRCYLIWKLKGFSIKTIPTKSKFSLRKIITEIVGIMIVSLYFLGIKFPEMYFRKKYRTV